MILLWSDTHFGHRGILTHCPATRPYATVEDMNAGLIERWNAGVNENDDVFLVGDFAFGPAAASVFEKLRGRKHLVIGNHDEKNPRVLKLPWLSQSHIKVVRENGASAVLCHYPLESWPSMHHGRFHAHGHCHGTLKRKMNRRFDVGADVYTIPVAMGFLASIAKEQEPEVTDHHKREM